ncbi:MAG: hypothetical protein IID17_12535, partial [Nitrospinae bacterium]|nr:hypothetical protein [Nitrospinota bacterium]
DDLPGNTELNEIIEAQGGRGGIENLASKLLEQPPEGVAKFARRSFGAKTLAMVQEAWISGMLSGPQTHIVNAGSNSLVALFTAGPENITTTMIGGLRRLIGGRERMTMRETLARMNGLRRGMRQGVSSFIETLVTGEGPDTFSKMETFRPGRRAAIPGTAGKVIRAPLTLLEASDAFFKMANYASELEGLATREASKSGLKGRALREEISRIMENPTKEMDKAAWQTARKNTFTNQLGGSWLDVLGRGGQALNRHLPLFRFLFPFIRTPANIVKFSMERTPLALSFGDVREALMGKHGAIARDQAMARILLGSTIGYFVAEGAFNGQITGGAPRDTEERALWEASGRQEYSILVNGKWVSFARMEPWGSIFGMAADMGQMRRYMTEDESKKVTALLVTSIARNTTSKTFMRGASELLKAWNDPERSGSNLIENFVASFVPGAVSQAERTFDPALREARGMMDRIKSRIPVLSGTLEEKLNLWGEVRRYEGTGNKFIDSINPIYLREFKQDPVAEEMMRLRVFPGMPERRIGGVALEPKQYWEYVKTAGQAAKADLDGRIMGSGWDGLSDNQKKRQIRKIILRHRSLARLEMMGKYPELLEKKIERRLRRFE